MCRQSAHAVHKSRIIFQLYERDCTRTEFEQGGLLDDLKKALAGRILNAELDHHRGQEGEHGAGTPRKGTNPKSMLTDTGKLEIWARKNFCV
jgi:putative transposase